jgi:hypothetical protein
MVEQSSKHRPSTASLSTILPPEQCCLPADNVSNSQSSLDERQVVPSDMVPMHRQNPPQPAKLEDQASAEKNKLPSKD